jgi:uncharacterized protein YdhG (YjbR/CyaY superfamily)
MKEAAKSIHSVDEYIRQFPSETQKKLSAIRDAIRSTAPQATESISYRMPAYKMKRYIIFFAGFEKHIGIYPLPSGIRAFAKELGIYNIGKGSVQIPLEGKIPLALIKKIVRYRIKEEEKSPRRRR